MNQEAIESDEPQKPSGSERRAGVLSLRIGACLIQPDLDRISGPAGETRIEPKTMDVLLYLARRPDKVVATDELINAVWLGRPMGDNPVYRCIALLRRALGDDPRAPTYIATVPKKGYRLVASVEKIETTSPDELNRQDEPDLQQLVTRASRQVVPVTKISVIILAVLAALISWLVLGLDRDNEMIAPVITGPITLAVLPFDNLSGDPDQEYLTDALSEAILNRLSAYKGLRVIARSSSFAFKGSDYGASQISHLLDVRLLLHGNLRREGGRLRLSVELVDDKGFLVWNETFDYVVDDDFALRDRIAAEVTSHIAPHLASPPDSRQPDFQAYQHFMIGHEILVRRPPGFRDIARSHFDRAIEIDPGYAEAHAERAITSIFLGFLKNDPEPYFIAAQHDIDRTLVLDPGVAQAHAAQGLLLQVRAPYAYAESEVHLRRALALNPNQANVWTWLGNALKAQGLHDEAEEAWKSAARVDPLAPSVAANLATEELRRGEAVAAERRLLHLMKVPQPAIVVHRVLIVVYVETGRFSKALDVAKNEMLLWAESRDGYPGMSDLISLYAMLGANDRAIYWHNLFATNSQSPLVDIIDRSIAVAPAIGGYGAAVRNFDAALSKSDMKFDQLSLSLRHKYGLLLALAKQPRRARTVLEPAIDAEQAEQSRNSRYEINARLALAWAWLNTGESERANALLKLMDRRFRDIEAAGRLHRGTEIIEYALNQALLGDTIGALNLLDRARQTGWRGYYIIAHDPRWNVLSHDSRFQSIMAEIKADLDVQLAEINHHETQDDFISRLDAAVVSRIIEQKRSQLVNDRPEFYRPD